MNKLLLLFTMLLPVLAFSQDCSGKIKAAQASKTAGNYRLALAQFTAAASSCGESRRAEIEKEILDIYDRIEKLKDEALVARNLAKTEADKAKASEKIAADALSSVQKANLIAKAAFDSLGTLLFFLEKANEDKVSLILAEVARNQKELNFDAAVDKIKTAKILRALPDSVNRAYQDLSRSLLSHAREDLQHKDYKAALAKIKSAGELTIQPDSVATANRLIQNFLVENARLDIVNTDYDAAVEKINALNTLKVPVDTVLSLYFETAFCYTEVGSFNRAAGLLDTIAQLRQNAAVRALLKELAEKEPSQKRQLLRQAMIQIDPQRNNSLLARYFPTLTASIPAGTLTMGGDPGAKAKGACQVTITPFHLGTKELTFFEYDLFCAATKRPKPSDNGWGRGSRPVIDIDWYDAIAYCNWRSRQENLQEVYQIDEKILAKYVTVSQIKQEMNFRILSYSEIVQFKKDLDEINGNANFVKCNWSSNGYRLPSETEWFFASGNGEKHTRFSWGDSLPTALQGGNVTDETAKTLFPNWEIFDGYSDGFAYTAPVGFYQSNDFGLYDMTGNVWEWCWDWYDENYCRANKNKNAPQGPASGVEKVLRGGSWGSFPKDCFVSNRFHNKLDTRNFSIGFRLARN